MKWFFVVLAFLFLGCATADLTPDKLASADSFYLCNKWHQNKSWEIWSELVGHEAITQNEWPTIERGKFYIGMSELGLVCSWGLPNYYGAVNKSVGPWGVHKQYVYRNSRRSQAMYIYVENGKITSWSK